MTKSGCKTEQSTGFCNIILSPPFRLQVEDGNSIHWHLGRLEVTGLPRVTCHSQGRRDGAYFVSLSGQTHVVPNSAICFHCCSDIHVRSRSQCMTQTLTTGRFWELDWLAQTTSRKPPGQLTRPGLELTLPNADRNRRMTWMLGFRISTLSIFISRMTLM